MGVAGASALNHASLLACLGLAAAAWLGLVWRRVEQREAWLWMLLFAVGGALYAIARATHPDDDAVYRFARDHASEPVTLEGRVREVPVMLPGEDYARVIVDATQVEHEGRRRSIGGGVLLRWSDPDHALLAGQSIRVRGVVSPVMGTVNHGIGSMENAMRTRGVQSQLRVRGPAVEIVSEDRWSPMYWASRLRLWQAERMSGTLPDAIIPFIRTVWLGDRTQLRPESYQPYIHSGTAHILAVSGVHVSIIFYSIELLLRGLLRSRRTRTVVILIAVFTFALVAGARLSSLRAATMIGLYLAARLFGRDPDAPTALSFAAAVFLLVNPALVFDTGFLLSFGSVASIILFSDAFRAQAVRAPRLLRESAATSLSVQVLTLPLVAKFFYVLPLFAPLANLFVVPLLTAGLWLCFLMTLALVVAPPVAMLFGYAAYPIVWLIEAIASFVAQLRFASWTVTPPSAAAFVLYYAAAALLLHGLYRRAEARALWPLVDEDERWWQAWRRVLAASAACLVLAAIVWQPRPERGVVDILDVGHGDATLVRTPGGTTILIDGGDRSEYVDYGRTVVQPALYTMGVTSLDYIVATHPDRDHLGGLLSVLDLMPVRQAILSSVPSGRPLEAGLVEACELRDIPLRRLGAGDALDVAGASVEILHPPKSGYRPGNVNDASLVLRISWPGFSALITGDIEAGAERLLAETDCTATVLRVPHHGSHTSSTDALLVAVHPAAAIVSTRASGRRNAMGAGVAERYEAHGIPLWRTDLDGGLRLRATENGVSIRGAREAKGWGSARASTDRSTGGQATRATPK